MQRITTWFVIADGARARFFSNNGMGSGLKVAVSVDLTGENAPSRDMGTDRSGRSADHTGNMRHTMDSKSDLHEESEKNLAHEIATLLDNHRKKKAYDALVVVAAPKMLGYIRAAISDDTKSVISCEFDKDLTKVSHHDLPSRLNDLGVGVKF